MSKNINKKNEEKLKVYLSKQNATKGTNIQHSAKADKNSLPKS